MDAGDETTVRSGLIMNCDIPAEIPSFLNRIINTPSAEFAGEARAGPETARRDTASSRNRPPPPPLAERHAEEEGRRSLGSLESE